VVVVAALGVGGVGGCGIPIDEAPQPVDLPPQYQPTSSTVPPPTAASGTELTALLCLTDGQSLVEVHRPVQTPQSPADLLGDLVAGATESERQEQRLDSALTGLRTLSVAGVDNGVAEVAVGDGLDAITDSIKLLIYGQIVCTLDAHPDIVGVRFSRDGQRLPVPRGDATTTDGVLTVDDYDELRPPSATSTGTP
jgi:hypothetical protein